MISGYQNLSYLAYGERRYGTQPILGKMREFWEFEFILKGLAHPSGVNTPIVKQERPLLYVSHPNSPHGWTDKINGISEIFVVQFREVPEELKERIEPTKPLIIEIDKDSFKELIPQFMFIRKNEGKSDAHTSLSLLSFLIDLTKLAVSQLPNTALRTAPVDKVSRAMHWFEENLGRSPSVEDAARAVGTSTAHLRRLFTNAGCPSPKSELTRLQIEAAQRNLLEGWPQKSIANFLGFSDTSTFARAFKEVCNLPPGTWLKRKQNGVISVSKSKSA